ncbi:MAG: ABC transporter substrate-binding protein [Comamonas sp.]|jgi:iron complex transport system substrate-binding protein|uniref:ABC transporter substrate-binding protein n=1 Tax=Comamonas sp. TaxID=34028 RepID=UPI00281B7DFB|nr:ABC transporter substrate-binding protein [Comamonas sp.]MDR0213973.1 ABC transporter substrate-binding protein [Comamonas sp.]
MFCLKAGLRRASVVLACLPIGVLCAQSADGPSERRTPERIVSLNLCTDQLLLQLVPHERIAALSHVSQDPRSSALHAQAAALPTVRGNAEEVLALKPDLVLVGTYTTRHTNAMLRKFGIQVVAIPGANSFEDVRKEIREVAQAVNEELRGEQLIARFDHRLAQLLASVSTEKKVAMRYSAGGYTAGTNTLYDAIFEAAGLENGARQAKVKGYGRMPMERLIAQRPAIILGSDYKPETPTQGNRMLTHPAIKGLHAKDVVLESRDIVCGGLWNLDAAIQLRAASQ